MRASQLLDRIMEMDAWSGYISVRGYLVRGYFHTSWLVILAVGFGLLSVLLNPIFWYLLGGNAVSLWEIIIGGLQILLSVVIVAPVVFLISLLLMPTIKVWGGNLVERPEIEGCALLMWHPQHKYWCKPARRWLFWRRAPRPYPRSVYTDPAKLDRIKELAITDSSTAWGQTTVLSIFLGIGIALISTLVSLKLWEALSWQWQLCIAGLTFLSLFLAIMSALVANAAVTIAQAITLLDVEALQNENKREKSATKGRNSPWFMNDITVAN
jgi:hypothetical protein